MQFKQWLEIVEPVKAKGIRKSNFVINPGTNTARPATRFKWKTSLGNVIDLHFQHGQDGSYTVVFYVNGTLFDDAPKNTVNNRDSEILPTVMHTIRDKADALNAQELTFRAAKSDNDQKIIRNLPIKNLSVNAIDLLQQLKQKVSTHEVRMVPPPQSRIDLYLKLKRPPPIARPDIDQSRWMKWANLIQSLIEKQESFGNLTTIKGAGLEPNELQSIGFDPTQLVQILKELDQVFKSMTPEGLLRNKNRRAVIYDKLMQRYMSDKWNISRTNDYFELTRKSI